MWLPKTAPGCTYILFTNASLHTYILETCTTMVRFPSIQILFDVYKLTIYGKEGKYGKLVTSLSFSPYILYHIKHIQDFQDISTFTR